MNKKTNRPDLEFRANEYVVYPAHGVGRIVTIEKQEIAGTTLELYVISFEKDKMTLRVPTNKATAIGMRSLSSPDLISKTLDTLGGRAKVKRAMWSKRAQEYEQKIHSGDLISIAEAVRDLCRSDDPSEPEQSYSERQLYEAAVERLVSEVSAVRQEDVGNTVKFIAKETGKHLGLDYVPAFNTLSGAVHHPLEVNSGGRDTGERPPSVGADFSIPVPTPILKPRTPRQVTMPPPVLDPPKRPKPTPKPRSGSKPKPRLESRPKAESRLKPKPKPTDGRRVARRGRTANEVESTHPGGNLRFRMTGRSRNRADEVPEANTGSKPDIVSAAEIDSANKAALNMLERRLEEKAGRKKERKWRPGRGAYVRR